MFEPVLFDQNGDYNCMSWKIKKTWVGVWILHSNWQNIEIWMEHETALGNKVYKKLVSGGNNAAPIGIKQNYGNGVADLLYFENNDGSTVPAWTGTDNVVGTYEAV